MAKKGHLLPKSAINSELISIFKRVSITRGSILEDFMRYRSAIPCRKMVGSDMKISLRNVCTNHEATALHRGGV